VLIVPTTLSKTNLQDPVTSHLHQNFTRLAVSQTVGAALEWLRANPPPGRIIYLYVVDPDGKLCGVVPTRRLLLAAPETRLEDIMVRDVVLVPATATVLEACEFFIQHRFLAFPVVDDQRRLLGVVDVDMYTDELTDIDDADARNHLFQSVGVTLERGRGTAPASGFRRRFPWLGCNLAAGIIAAFLSGLFEDVLSRAVALAFFIPVVLNMAESVSSQSVSLALLALHGQRPTWKLLAGRLRKELITGLLLGLAAGVAVALTALIWRGSLRIALCVMGGIAGGVTGAAMLGIAMPTVLRLIRLEPRVAAGPVALAGADIITILLYLNLARWLLG
jgi:magnesium transporter